MNERIKELMVKAGMQFRLGNIPTHISFDGTHTFNEYYVYDKFDPEKFAELIVRECLEACSRANEIRHFVPPTQEQVVLSCMREIEQHFGVEE